MQTSKLLDEGGDSQVLSNCSAWLGPVRFRFQMGAWHQSKLGSSQTQICVAYTAQWFFVGPADLGQAYQR